MPSYQTTACKTGANGQIELVASHEFDAADTPTARTKAETWSTTAPVASSGATLIRLYAGRVLLSERNLASGQWQEPPR